MFYKIKRAFTLVELLVVMGVLAILAAGLIAVINPADRVNLANDTKAAADLNQIVGGLQAYAANNGGLYPTTLTAGTNTGDGTNGATKGWGPVQALIPNEIGTNPTSINSYVYGYNCNATGTTCKMGVTQKAKKNSDTTQGGSVCWTTSAGVTVYKGAVSSNAPTSNLTCP